MWGGVSSTDDQTLKKGDYYWCTCGRSTKQPFCNGSVCLLFAPVCSNTPRCSAPRHQLQAQEGDDHQKGQVLVLRYVAVRVCGPALTLYVGCKQTKDENGFCDGTHNKLEVVQKYNKQLLQANSALREAVKEQKQSVTFAVATAAAILVIAVSIYLKK